MYILATIGTYIDRIDSAIDHVDSIGIYSSALNVLDRDACLAKGTKYSKYIELMRAYIQSQIRAIHITGEFTHLSFCRTNDANKPIPKKK